MTCSCTNSVPTPLPSACSLEETSTSTSTSTSASASVEAICNQTMNNCQSVCRCDTRNCPGGCNGEPLSMAKPVDNSQVSTEVCCDQNGCCGVYLRCCRDPFWPSFAKPTWLCCRDLYRQ